MSCQNNKLAVYGFPALARLYVAYFGRIFAGIYYSASVLSSLYSLPATFCVIKSNSISSCKPQTNIRIVVDCSMSFVSSTLLVFDRFSIKLLSVSIWELEVRVVKCLHSSRTTTSVGTANISSERPILARFPYCKGSGREINFDCCRTLTALFELVTIIGREHWGLFLLTSPSSSDIG